MTRWVAVACAAVFVGPPASAQRRPAAEPSGWNAFTAAFDAYACSDRVVGAVVVPVRQGRVQARHAYGLGDRARGAPPGEQDVYHWASITKTLAAIAVMQLRDRGLLSLDDPVTRWVPELRQMHDPYGSIDAVTLRMLLSHSAGFQGPAWPYGGGRPWEPFEPTRWEQLVAMILCQELTFAPGSRFGYSNPGFVYLARVIEATTGDPWAVYTVNAAHAGRSNAGWSALTQQAVELVAP